MTDYEHPELRTESRRSTTSARSRNQRRISAWPEDERSLPGVRKALPSPSMIICSCTALPNQATGRKRRTEPKCIRAPLGSPPSASSSRVLGALGFVRGRAKPVAPVRVSRMGATGVAISVHYVDQVCPGIVIDINDGGALLIAPTPPAVQQ